MTIAEILFLVMTACAATAVILLGSEIRDLRAQIRYFQTRMDDVEYGKIVELRCDLQNVEDLISDIDEELNYITGDNPFDKAVIDEMEGE